MEISFFFSYQLILRGKKKFTKESLNERKERGREHIQLLMQLGSEEQGSSQCGLGYRTKPHLLEICGNGWGLGGPLQTFQGVKPAALKDTFQK